MTYSKVEDIKTDLYNFFAQKSSPGVVLARGLLLAVYGPALGPDGPRCPEKP